MRTTHDTSLFASLAKDVLDLLDGTIDVVGDGVASALGRARVRVVGALAVTTSGLRKLCASSVSIVKNMSKEQKHSLPLTAIQSARCSSGNLIALAATWI